MKLGKQFNRGGARKGAGRKPEGGRQLHVWLGAYQLQQVSLIQQWTGCSERDVIRQAVDQLFMQQNALPEVKKA